jgi:hypothetical protein
VAVLLALAARPPRPPGAAAAAQQIQPWAAVVGVRRSLLGAERRLQPWCPGGACAPAWLTPSVGEIAFLQERTDAWIIELMRDRVKLEVTDC